ncbi:MAG: hypothetical protein HRT57_03215 [Crocinitomicaceae bacterium]|nr:hypothetical protein [Crocinitomicaceae bacterium]
MYKLLLISGLISIISFNGMSQRAVEDSIIGTPWVSVQYGLNFTAGDLKENHGFFNHIGLFAGYKTDKNWIYGLDASYMFGADVRATGLFDHLVDSKGNITDQNGDIATVQVQSRGMYTNLSVGKVLPVLSPNPNSGLYLSFGAGFLAHKLRVETQEHVVPELELDYKKGYDRLSQGVNISQFVGYAYMANQGFVNFYAGFYIQEGFTYNRREIFFDTPNTPVSKDMMLDIQYGIKLAWLIPVYQRKPKEFYFN